MCIGITGFFRLNFGLDDFADSLYELILGLRKGATNVFEFTDSSATIRFHRSSHDHVEVTSATDSVATVNYDELCAAALRLLRDVLSLVLEKRGGLIHNDHFRKSLARAGMLS